MLTGAEQLPSRGRRGGRRRGGGPRSPKLQAVLDASRCQAGAENVAEGRPPVLDTGSVRTVLVAPTTQPPHTVPVRPVSRAPPAQARGAGLAPPDLPVVLLGASLKLSGTQFPYLSQ